MLALAFATACFGSLAGGQAPAERAELTTGFSASREMFPFDDARVVEILTVRRERAVFDEPHSSLALAPTLEEPAIVELRETETWAFRELFASWNVVTPPGTGFGVEVRVRQVDQEWSPWLWLGDWGELPELVKTRAFDGAKIAIDAFTSGREWDAWQVRVRAFRVAAGDEPLLLERVDVTIADRTRSRDATLNRWKRPNASSSCGVGTPSGPLDPRKIEPVPFRSQRAEDPKIAGRICSPTSVAMVLERHGVHVTTADVAARLYDREQDTYGNWSRAIQGAFTFGLPGYLTRFSTWEEARTFTGEHARPLVISIAAKKGELTGAPYAKTDGHLLVLRGFDANGAALVNDPAAKDAEHGVTKYARDELERCWMGHGGVAYVLLPRTKDTEAADKPR